MEILKVFCSAVLICSLCACSTTKFTPLELKDVDVVKRNAKSLTQGERTYLDLDAVESDGMAILKNVSFQTGTIKMDIKGENKPGQSFVGFAFNIIDEETYEAIYFRPFNFVATEQIRKDHMVQYVHHPEFTWRKLREEKTGQFEAEIQSPPDPDNWFTVTIEIDKERVKVFLPHLENPVLDVPRLNQTKSDKIAAWVGFNSRGSFDNIIINSK